MPSNFWEEQRMSIDIIKVHEKLMEEMNLPQWIKDSKCPYCNKNLPLRSIRNIQLCLNTRNFGEIAIELICDTCNKMDTVYYRTIIGNISQFIEHLNGKVQVGEKPLVEKDMCQLPATEVRGLAKQLASRKDLFIARVD